MGIPPSSEFSLSTPNLLPRVRRLGDVRPFPFLTGRLLEPSRNPDDLRSELVAFVDQKDHAGQAKLMARPCHRSWGSVVEDFFRHRDRKYVFEPGGQAIRRRVLVRKESLVPLGKEANRFEDARVLGLRAVGGRAKRYGDPDPFKGSATEVARRLGVSRRTVFNRRMEAQAPEGHPSSTGPLFQRCPLLRWDSDRFEDEPVGIGAQWWTSLNRVAQAQPLLGSLDLEDRGLSDQDRA